MDKTQHPIGWHSPSAYIKGITELVFPEYKRSINVKKSLLSFPDCSPDDSAILNYLHLDKGCDIIPEVLQENLSKIFHLSQQDI